MYDEFTSVEALVKTAAAESVSQIRDRLVRSQKPVFTEDEFNTLLSLDPTYSGGDKVGAYTLWLIKTAKKDKKILNEDAYKAKEYLEIFNQVKNRLPQDQKRIENYSVIQDLFQVIEPYRSGDEDIQSEGQKKRELYKEKDEINTLYNDNDWLVISPLTMGAACYWGSGTEWCTATRNEERNYFDHYNSQGSLYIFIYKDGEKWQLHTQSRQFMDSTDNSISFKDLFDNRETSTEFLKFVSTLVDIELPDEAESSMAISLSQWLYDNYSRSPRYYCRCPLSYSSVQEILNENVPYFNNDDLSLPDNNIVDASNEEIINSLLVNNYNVAINNDFNWCSYVYDSKNGCDEICDCLLNAFIMACKDEQLKYEKNYVIEHIETFTDGTVSGDNLTFKFSTSLEYYKRIIEDETAERYEEDNDREFYIDAEEMETFVGCDVTYFNVLLKEELSQITLMTDKYKEQQDGQQFLFNENDEPSVSYASFNNLCELVGV